MTRKASALAAFEDPYCNPFTQDAQGPDAICLETGLRLQDIPESYARQVWLAAGRSTQAPQAPDSRLDFIDVPEPVGFSMADYQARKIQPVISDNTARQRAGGPVAADRRPGGTGKPHPPAGLPPVPTGLPGNGTVTTEGIVATNRFGLGALPGELEEASGNPQQWLKDQLTYDAVRMPFAMPESHECVLLRMGVFDDPNLQEVVVPAIDKLESLRQKNRTPGIPEIDDVLDAQNYQGKLFFQEIRLRDFMACTTRAPFAERLVRFWTNHFAITANANTQTMVGDFERTVSRRFYLGKFSNLIVRATLHQGMLNFLNNVESVGPNSPYGVTIGNPPANENLAREVLELHSLGSEGGYTQADVEELANALTGCIHGFAFHGAERVGRFLFEPLLHEPGERTFLGKQYAEDNESAGQAIAILNDIARHPATIARLCRKIAAHFTADTPPQGLVDNLITVWEQTDGELGAIYKALVDNPLSWDNSLEKFKTPNDLLNSAARAVGKEHVFGDNEQSREYLLYLLYLDLGQFPFTPPTPEGWSDDGPDWAQPSPMMARMQWANQVASRLGTIKPGDLLNDTVGPDISEDTAFWTGGAATPQQGLTLAFMSPEFQRR
ncbi:DUF1800 family protein [Parvularcula sp. IMCC14364]|uniref:DUF1800 domain-containing protein n=1 Tax=Parvularcula sp. IMCC14364 TaxID=3067902 RepID=UPI0027423591|nr:DUF1800 domain-containing protein [Parvularcula sp. IMCC14364]